MLISIFKSFVTNSQVNKDISGLSNRRALSARQKHFEF